MTNFDFLKDDPQFSGFADAAIAAERILAATAVLDCRRAMEFAVKWMYSVDSSLVKPWDDKLISLMSTEEFHDIVDDDLWRRMDFIRKRGNDAAHGASAGNRRNFASKTCFCSLISWRTAMEQAIRKRNLTLPCLHNSLLHPLHSPLCRMWIWMHLSKKTLSSRRS